MVYWCFQRGEKWEGLFLNKYCLWCTYDTGVFKGNGKVFLWNFFEHPKERLRPADLNHFLSARRGQKTLLGCALLGVSVPRLTLWWFCWSRSYSNFLKSVFRSFTRSILKYFVSYASDLVLSGLPLLKVWKSKVHYIFQSVFYYI